MKTYIFFYTGDDDYTEIAEISTNNLQILGIIQDYDIVSAYKQLYQSIDYLNLNQGDISYYTSNMLNPVNMTNKKT